MSTKILLEVASHIFLPYQYLFDPINSILNTPPGDDGKDLENAVKNGRKLRSTN
jgi:hypothetical protein